MHPVITGAPVSRPDQDSYAVTAEFYDILQPTGTRHASATSTAGMSRGPVSVCWTSVPGPAGSR